MKKLTIFLIFVILIIGCDFRAREKTDTSNKIENQKEEIEISQTKNNEIEFQEFYKKIKKIRTPDFTRGIYLTTYTVASEKFEPLLDQAQDAGINSVIFDVKNMEGDVFLSGHQKDTLRAKKYKPIINITETVKVLHKRNMKAVCRVVVFHDQFLAENFPELRPASADGGHWQESKNRKASWLDSSNPEVQGEILEIIERVARLGVDEIQMDYIRFPTQGDLDNATFYFQKEDDKRAIADTNYIRREKVDIIENFIKETKNLVKKYDVTLTADIFAIVAWQRDIDVMNTGQNIKRISGKLDGLHPMIYSSHFGQGFSYRENIYNEPYYIIFRGTQLTINNADSGCAVIPYIQANSWKVNYSKGYVLSQIRAIEDAGGDGFILWNSSNNYSNTLMWIGEYYAD